MWDQYGKAIIATVAAGVTVLHAAMSDGLLSPQEDVQILIALATAAGVFLVPTLPRWPYAKTIIAVLLAVLNVAVTAVVNGLTSGDWTEMALAALTILGVGAAPAISIGGAVAEPPGPDGNPLH